MTVIYVEHIETCQQGDESINTRVIYWRWYNEKLFFFINGCANFARTLSTFSVSTHLMTLKLHVVKIWYKHRAHGIEIIWLQGNVKTGVFCQLRVFCHYLHGALDHSGKSPPLSNRGKYSKWDLTHLDLNGLAHLIIIRSGFYIPQASINLPWVVGTTCMLIIVLKGPLCHELHLAKIKL